MPLTFVFYSLKRELSRPATNGAQGDEEEGGNASNSTFVDLEEYLTRANREAEELGIIPKKIGVRFRNLTVQGSGSGSIFVRTFADELLGLLGKDIFNLIRGWVSGQKPTVKNILHDFSGVVKPGEMLLVLGNPGSGSSTFLRALTNQRRDFTAIKGDVDYSGLGFETAKRQFRGEILYNTEGGFINLGCRYAAANIRAPHRGHSPANSYGRTNCALCFEDKNAEQTSSWCFSGPLCRTDA